MLTRRHFIQTTSALFSAAAVPGALLPSAAAAEGSSNWAAWDARVTPANYVPETSNPWGFHPRFLPTRVEARAGLAPGNIHVDAVARYLYFIESPGVAQRYGVAIARGKLYEPGTYTIRRKAKWPKWTPTAAMMKRDPKYVQFEDGVPGGPTNPLGARAFYLYVGNRDTYLRIHGTPSPKSIGGRASSGCVRMAMPHVIGLYDLVKPGATAYLYPSETDATLAS
ncbi:L,D-transpeptidase [Rhodobacteraceae bacterium KMM 6894]|nr:L,D-transpeptidase [Rhodobacteraceae bacterium KMM 6894]